MHGLSSGEGWIVARGALVAVRLGVAVARVYSQGVQKNGPHAGVLRKGAQRNVATAGETRRMMKNKLHISMEYASGIRYALGDQGIISSGSLSRWLHEINPQCALGLGEDTYTHPQELPGSVFTRPSTCPLKKLSLLLAH